MEIFGFIIIFISLVIAWQTWRNGQWIKDMLRTIHEEGEKRHKGVLKMLEKMDERTAQISEMMEKMDERTAKISELIERIPEKTARIILEK